MAKSRRTSSDSSSATSSSARPAPTPSAPAQPSASAAPAGAEWPGLMPPAARDPSAELLRAEAVALRGVGRLKRIRSDLQLKQFEAGRLTREQLRLPAIDLRADEGGPDEGSAPESLPERIAAAERTYFESALARLHATGRDEVGALVALLDWNGLAAARRTADYRDCGSAAAVGAP